MVVRMSSEECARPRARWSSLWNAAGGALLVVLFSLVARWAGWTGWWAGPQSADDWLTLGETLFGILLTLGFLRDFLTPPCPPSHPAHRPPGRVRAWALELSWRFRAIVIAAGAVVVFAGEYYVGWYTWDFSLLTALLWTAVMFGLAAWCRPEQPCGAAKPTDPA